MFRYGEPVIDDQGRTGEIDGRIENGRVRVVFYNHPAELMPVDRLEHNDYADSEQEEHDMRRAMGDDEYDRMHGITGYNDEDEYMENINRLRELAGMPEQVNEVDRRKMTNELHRMMDDGEIDPRAVADAALLYMSEDDVADMMHANEIGLDLGGDDEDDRGYTEPGGGFDGDPGFD